MGFIIYIAIVVLLGLVVMLVGAPLRRAGDDSETQDGSVGREDAAESAAAVREELETAREAKYKEIRDAELDYRTGKLSDSDYEAIDADLRAEALAILDALERLPGEPDQTAPQSS